MLSRRGTIGGLLQRVHHGRLYRGGTKKGVIVLPGSFGTVDDYFNLNYPVLEAIHAQGFATASLTTLNTWGNSTIRTDVSTLKTNCQTAQTPQPAVFAAGKVHLVGISMGGLIALNWAKANPTLVQSITLVIPVLDVQAVYDENRGTFTSLIAPAYGGGRPTDADNPIKNAGSFTGFPINLYYSTTDPITTLSESESFAAATGAVPRSMGALGHGSGAPWGGADMARFIAAHD